MLYHGMEDAAQGMIAMQALQAVVSNNLANANTAGFMQDNLSIADFGNTYAAAIGEGIPAGYTPAGGGLTGNTQLLFKTATEFSQGKLKETGETFDLAIEGKGFFAVQANDGVRFTRDGSFTVNGQGYLVTKEGNFVLGDKGPIKITGGDFKVKPDGTILSDKKVVDKLRMIWVDPKDLNKVGQTDYKTTNPLSWHDTERPRIMQGYLETSNVNPVQQMIQLIVIMRAFDASQKMIQAEDSMAQKANNTYQLGK